MPLKVEHSRLRRRVEDAAERTVTFLKSMQAERMPAGVLRSSSHHDLEKWPDMLLPGTYNGTLCLKLIGGLDLSPDEQAYLRVFIDSYQQPDGFYCLPSMRDDTVYKKENLTETWEYIHFHVTNYALGALESLGAKSYKLAFLKPYLEEDFLGAWLARRDLRDPWLEGNNVVNLACFLFMYREQVPAERAQADALINDIMRWHMLHQEPATGFWGVGQTLSAEAHLHAMAGAAHNFHLYFKLGVPVPHEEQIIDYCLDLGPQTSSACLDVDAVDILANLTRQTGYRRTHALNWLEAKLTALLALQNADGGFPDVASGVRRFDGWPGGYSEPQGLSNGFATWFRWIAVAMICEVLWPGWRAWMFRETLGIGYFSRGT